eukprot:7490340-Karenia_brevis.AAC.1
MRCVNNIWPQADNILTIRIELDYQTTPEVDTTTAHMVRRGEHVNTHCPPVPPPWTQAVARGTPINITKEEMLHITGERKTGPAPRAHIAERMPAPQGLQQPWCP